MRLFVQQHVQVNKTLNLHITGLCEGNPPQRGAVIQKAFHVIMSSCKVKPHMMTSSIGNIFRVTGHLCGEFTGPGELPTQRPVTRSFDVFFHLRLNKRLSKQPWGWWFETLYWSLWRHRNAELSLQISSREFSSKTHLPKHWWWKN